MPIHLTLPSLMGSQSIRHILKQLFWWLLLLQLINLSTNPADFRQLKNRSAAQEATDPVNEIETLYELVAEDIFDKTVPDTEDQDTDTRFEFFDLFSLPLRHIELILVEYPFEHISFYRPYLSLVHEEPNSPPPRQAYIIALKDAVFTLGNMQFVF